MSPQNAGGVWPPPPQNHDPLAIQTGKLPVTPEATRKFFFLKCVIYGTGFGAVYGGGVGLCIFVIGVLYGFPIGMVLGLILGIIDGVILAYVAGRQISMGLAVPIVARTFRRAAPLVTVFGGAVLGLIIGEYSQDGLRILVNPIFLALCGISALSSWHAAWLAAKKFVENYE